MTKRTESRQNAPQSRENSISLPRAKKTKDATPAPRRDSLRPSSRRGRPPRFSAADRERALAEYLAGDSAAEIAARIGCSSRTVRDWIKAGDWGAELRARRETTAGLEAQILRL